MNLLKFFDEKPPSTKTHATSIVAVAGEDLNAACFQHYLKSIGATAEIRRDPVTTGNRRGHWLDRWIAVCWSDQSNTVFQTEIKNWSAHAIGGETLSASAKPNEVTNYKEKRWNLRWNAQKHILKWPALAKVLAQMNPPVDVDQEIVRPLIIFWEAIGPRDKANDHLFSIRAPNDDWAALLTHEIKRYAFPELWVFSVSSYLRSLREANIPLELPNVATRLGFLQSLFQTEGK